LSTTDGSWAMQELQMNNVITSKKFLMGRVWASSRKFSIPARPAFAANISACPILIKQNRE